jgi:hypothetical protein
MSAPPPVVWQPDGVLTTESTARRAVVESAGRLPPPAYAGRVRR